MKNYIKKFFSNEDGAETIEFVAILGVAVGIIAIVVAIGATMQDRASKAQNVLEQQDF